jgi:hypothetical protein
MRPDCMPRPWPSEAIASCANCRHWRLRQVVQIVDGGSVRQGECHAPIPAWAGTSGRRLMGEHEGGMCHAHAPTPSSGG